MIDVEDDEDQDEEKGWEGLKYAWDAALDGIVGALTGRMKLRRGWRKAVDVRGAGWLRVHGTLNTATPLAT